MFFFDICKRERDFLKKTHLFLKKLQLKDDMRDAVRGGRPAGVAPHHAACVFMVHATYGEGLGEG